MLTTTEPPTVPAPVVFDLGRFDSSFAVGLDDGRIRIDLGVDISVFGTLAQLLDLGASITSHALAINAERDR